MTPAASNDDAPDLLFVYGTLRRRGGTPAGRRFFGPSRYVGEARLKGRLFIVGGYPAASEEGGPEDVVYGELFRVGPGKRLLAEIDRYEGCDPRAPRPHAYRRAVRAVETDKGPVDAWVYLCAERPGDAIPVPGGDIRFVMRSRGMLKKP